MISGSCLCGAVRYEVAGAFGRVSHCHCSMCRKAHGAAFGTYGRVRKIEFRLVSGGDSIAQYNSSPDVIRTFCKRCGSTLQWMRRSTPDVFALALGTLDDDPEARPECHIYVGSKTSWFEITDALPQHDETGEVSNEFAG